MLKVPEGSIYFWMYEQGLKHVQRQEIEVACSMAGVSIREKDWQNYWNGFYRSDLYGNGEGREDIWMIKKYTRQISLTSTFFNTEYGHYDKHPYYGIEYPEIENRWVPCNKDNKPMIKWGNGCMSLADAVAYKDQVYLAENLKGTKFIVIDCDGNHGDTPDWNTMLFLNRWRDDTHCIVKPNCTSLDMPMSFHLTFKVDKIIPTMHFPYAHIDIVGNRRNSLRYWKNKQWNHIEPIDMTSERWHELQVYLKYRKEKADA